jgi:hypothetical protein
MARFSAMKFLSLFAAWVSFISSAFAATRPPNVVFILTDNQGAWTLGCYGNPDIRTPHIDQLAAEGTRFTHALSSNPVCSPTRATFLTGLIPSQHGLHSFLDAKYMMGPEAYNTLQEFTSLGEVLRDAGYTCGLSGKWHLGANMTPSEGFTTWTTKPDGGTQEFYDQKVIENGQLRVESGYTTDFWTRKGVEFIQANKDRPFFLYLAYNGPYSLGKLMLNESKNRHAAYYADKPLQSFPGDAMHPWQHDNKAFHNTDAARRRMASEVSGVDDGVGEIMAALKANGLDDNTLVVYSSDQGWMGGQNGMWGMGDHFRPIGAHELMMQIPCSASSASATKCRNNTNPPVATSPLPCAVRNSRTGKTPSSTKWKPPAPSAPSAGSTSLVSPMAPTNSTTCRPTHRNASTNTASPVPMRSKPISPNDSMHFSPSTPIRNTTSGKTAARRRSGMCLENGSAGVLAENRPRRLA